MTDSQRETTLTAPDGVMYYVDALAGDDRATGSATHPWRTLARVNEQVLQPGDAILFRAGCRWQGQLQPQGSGADGRPIRIDRYGEGARPVIDIGSAYGAAILLNNQEYWEIRNLEITSGAPAGLDHRQAILVLGAGAGRVFHHIVVSGCYIHDLWGLLGGHDHGIDSYSSTMILVASPRGDEVATFDEVLIEDNLIERVDRSGIIVWTPTPLASATRVVVRRNRMQNLGGDAILVLGSLSALVEYNVIHRSCLRSGDPNVIMSEGDDGYNGYNRSSAAIWLHTCDDSIMQFNEVYDSGKQANNNDGMAYDFDFDCHRCLLQYNYSRHNRGGFLLIMPTTRHNIIRFNISENDQWHVMCGGSQLEDGNLLYNNTFYIDYGTVEVYTGAPYANNLFYAGGQGRFKLIARVPGQFEHNAYWGPWMGAKPEDAGALLADPQLAAAGTGGEGLDSLSGYRLRPDSQCRDSGIQVPNQGGRDFWGEPLADERRIGA
ncbi:MAG: right-handed parallel beta-helix repeat-containing protein [Anaerolineae bacterium]